MAARSRKPNTSQSVTSGTTIRMEEPSSSRHHKQRTVTVPEIIPVRGFVDFLREHTVITIAVGFAIATQAQVLIKQLISSFIDPLYALLLNGDKLSSKTATLHFHGRTQQLGWGAFVYALIDFLFVLAAIYLIVKSLRLDKLEKKVEKEE